jgi:hypothetical protein
MEFAQLPMVHSTIFEDIAFGHNYQAFGNWMLYIYGKEAIPRSRGRAIIGYYLELNSGTEYLWAASRLTSGVNTDVTNLFFNLPMQS